MKPNKLLRNTFTIILIIMACIIFCGFINLEKKYKSGLDTVGFIIWGIMMFIAINLYSKEENHTINPEIIYPNKEISEIQQCMFVYFKSKKYTFFDAGKKISFSKKIFDGHLINERILIITEKKYNDTTKMTIEKEINKIKKNNIKKIDNNELYSRDSLQVFIITDEFNDKEDFYFCQRSYTITGSMGIQWNYGILIPIIFNKKDNSIIISGYKTKDSFDLMAYKQQKKRLKKIINGIIKDN